MTSRSPSPSRPRRQQGAVLFIAMVVLVAMAIAALALLRSTDVASLLSGNLAFKRSALNSTELGYQTALSSFPTINANNPTITQANLCYSANQVDVSLSNGVPVLMSTLSSFQSNFPGCSLPGSPGETVSYYIDRLCSITGLPQDVNCTSVLVLPTGTQSNQPPITIAYPAFRVTVRVDGPHNTTTFAQYIAKNT